jgi:hypothetical protein
MSNQFWNTVSRLVNRENEFKINLADGQFIKKNPFAIDAAFIGTAAYFVYSAFNNAVISKVNQVLPTILPEEGFTDLNLENFQGKLEFVTRRDDRVDLELCAPLDGVVFDANDPDLPIPPLHNHCRCTLIPVTEF